jgi:hypothetical protein
MLKCFESKRSKNATSRENTTTHFSRSLTDVVINKLVFVETEKL